MNLDLDSVADRGCWISDDRVYALITSAGGIGELGYHGLQPVSRNSRVLVRDGGVFVLSFRPDHGVERAMEFHEVDWNPRAVGARVRHPDGMMTVLARASGRQVHLVINGTVSRPGTVVVRVSKECPFADVHGERHWEPPRIRNNAVFLRCRDTIRLRPWLARKGAYAGDFLIPEVWRRVLFTRRVRSGIATPDDLRPEFRDANPLLYDAPIAVSFGGEGFTLREEPLAWVFERPVAPRAPIEARFVVACGESHGNDGNARATPPVLPRAANSSPPPSLSLAGFPAWESFHESVPELVDSCLVRDFGVPRACPGRYYWLWAWDMLVAAPEAARWGDRKLGETVAMFVDAHRDTNGIIPARWTRSLLPLDTPSPGGIEFLYGALAYENFLESGDVTGLLDATRGVREQFSRASAQLRETGMLTGEGFYPDLLGEFGRGPESAVAMDVGSWYSLCRIVENISGPAGDNQTQRLAGECAAAIARTFLDRFWDGEAGFFSDAVEAPDGRRSRFHPLFALLFLQAPLGLSLIRKKLNHAARFVGERLLTEHGIRSIPYAESAVGGEPILDSWYPHWDLYALQLLRRGGDAAGIMRWLRRSEETLARLGYCPEFMALRGFREGDAAAWRHHGAASNLNCVTGWYRAVRESICGVVFDPGGLTHIPLSLPIDGVTIRDIRWRGGDWTIEVRYNGPHFLDMQADGGMLAGCLKVPARFAVPGRHHLLVRYGPVPPAAYFGELVNAEVRASSAHGGNPAVEIRGLGYLDGTFFSPDPAVVTLDGKAVESAWDPATGYGYFGVAAYGPHALRLTPRRPGRGRGD